MGKLAGKTAVITGGSSGIGFATAQAFQAEGARVAITGRDEQALRAAAARLGGDVLTVVADVSRLADLDTLFATVGERFGSLDVLFVNAGIGRFGTLAEVSETLFDEVMDINFKGAFFTIQKALPLLNDNAAIILNGSVNAHVGFPATSIYSASKAALHSLARTLAPELVERGIRINTLTIGPIDTPLYGKLNLPPEVTQGFAQAVAGKLPIKRFGTPEEVARAAVFLASPDSSLILGAELTTDGGLSLNTI